MLVLGIDTATKVAGAAIVDEGRLVSERFISNQRTHSVNLLPMVKQVIEDAEITPADLGGIAVAAGPGSFTGLRIGMAAAKTLSQVLNLPLIGVSTLEALAFNLAGYSQPVCPILDARKNEVYTALYTFQGHKLQEQLAPMATGIEELLNNLKGNADQVVFLGDAVPVYREKIVQILGDKALFAANINMMPRAAATAQLGLEKIMAGERAGLELEPTYIRPSEAEVTWQKKQQSGA